jgi:3',5'-cyclic AMP phosphodiesterase CpdA
MLSTMRLVHLSDIHYLARLAVPGRRFMNKRITGWVNLRMLRSYQHDSGLIEGILAAIRDAGPDHLAITGDLTNLSLGIEFAELRLLLGRIGLPPDSVTVVPGNHDRYTGGADRSNRVLAYLEPYMRSDVAGDGAFPVVRVREGVAIVGLDTSYSRPPFVASGRVGPRQLVRLVDLLGRGQLDDTFPVVLLHHPPYSWTTNRVSLRLSGLKDSLELYDALGGRSALLLHGHLHKNTYRRREMDGTTVHVVGVASATRHGRVRPHLLSTFHVFDVDHDGVRSIERYTLHPERRSYDVVEVSGEEFLPLEESGCTRPDESA